MKPKAEKCRSLENTDVNINKLIKPFGGNVHRERSRLRKLQLEFEQVRLAYRKVRSKLEME